MWNYGFYWWAIQKGIESHEILGWEENCSRAQLYQHAKCKITTRSVEVREDQPICFCFSVMRNQAGSNSLLIFTCSSSTRSSNTFWMSSASSCSVVKRTLFGLKISMIKPKTCSLSWKISFECKFIEKPWNKDINLGNPCCFRQTSPLPRS